MLRLLLASVSATALTAISAGSASAQTWTGATSNDWTVGSNWSTGTAPTGGFVTINTAGPVLGVGGPAIGSTSVISVGSISGSTGALTIQNGSTLTSINTPRLAVQTGSRGTVTITGPGSQWLITNGSFTVGFSGIGTLNIQDGGRVFAATGTTVGAGSTSSGTVNINGGGMLETNFLRNQLGVAQVNFDNGILRATASNATFINAFAGTELNILAGGLTIDTAGFTVGTDAASGFTGTGGLTVTGGGVFSLLANSPYSGETSVQASSGLSLLGAGAIANSSRVIADGTFDISGVTAAGTSIQSLAGSGAVALGAKNLTITNANDLFSGIISGAGGLTVSGGTLTLSGVNTYTGGTTVSGGLINFSALGNFGTGAITLDGGGLQWAASNTTDISSRLAPLGPGGGTFDTNGNNVTFGTGLTGTGALIKQGSGVLTLTGNGLYSGGTTISGGLINFAAANNFGTGLITLNGGGLQWAAGTSTDISSQLAPLGAAGGTFDTNGNNVTLATALSGTGGLTKQGLGQLTLTGNNTFTGATTVAGGILAVNGNLASGVTLNNGILGGSGTIGGLVANGGIVAPGNSIGTLTVNGNVVQNAGNMYQVEVNSAGQGDRINATGTATINGATVQVIAAPGNYGTSTTYTILNATGGVSGTYAGVTSNFAFLSPSLGYDANNVFLTLAFSGFGSGASTGNQKAVANALDQAYVNATGDFDTVIDALIGLSIQQGGPTLSAISGQPWADFGTMNVASNTLFMKAVGQQMALARGGQGSGQRQALAQACDVAACDAASPFSVWASGLGGFGSVQGDGNASTLTYNLGGAAAGIDYRVTPNVLLGVGAGYTSGTQWVDSFQGKGWTNAVSVAAYGSFTYAGFYADLLAGYAWSGNQLQRQISVPSLQPRTASGSTGANQFLGQAELGYQVPVYAPAAATITPFARLQVMSVNQAAFSEWGADSLSLSVQQQTTNSLRSTLGAELAGAIGLGNQRQLDLALRLGWLHEYAYIGRPVTAAFAGAPANGFTVYGATPQRDAAVIGFSASTAVAEATQLYLRYDGEIGSGTDNHAFNVGLRLLW